MTARSKFLAPLLLVFALVLFGALRGGCASRPDGAESVANGAQPIPVGPSGDGTHGAHAPPDEGAHTESRTDAKAAVVAPSARAEVAAEFEGRTPVRILGLVVDQFGQPVEGALVESKDADSREPTKQRTDAEGRFELRRPQSTRVWLCVEREAHHPLRDHLQLGETDYELKLELRRIPLTTFFVRDRVTGEPITRFRLDISYEHHGPYYGIRSTQLADHADGRCTVPAAVAYQSVGCEAPGYAYFRAPVEHDPAGSGTQTLLLERGARIVGNAEGALSVTLFGRGDLALMEPWLKQHSPNFRLGQVTPYTHQARTTELEHSPEFEFEDLRGGVYHVLVTRRDQSVIQFESLRVETGATLDLGRVDLEATGSLRGVLRATDGRSTAGFTLELDRPAAVHVAEARDTVAEEILRTTDAQGRFDFGDVSAGTHSVAILHGSRGGWHEPPLVVRVGAGEPSDVVWNIEPKLERRLRVALTHAGAPAVGVPVSETGEWKRLAPFAVTDSSGELDYVREPYSEASLLALSEIGIPLGIVDPASATAGASDLPTLLQLPLSYGSLELSLAGAIPADASAFVLRLERPDWPLVPIELPVLQLARASRLELDFAARKLVLPQIASGEWTVSASIGGAATDVVRRGYLARTRVRVNDARRASCELLFH